MTEIEEKEAKKLRKNKKSKDKKKKKDKKSKKRARECDDIDNKIDKASKKKKRQRDETYDRKDNVHVRIDDKPNISTADGNIKLSKHFADSENDTQTISSIKNSNNTSKLPFDYKYILAPMVGASELPFRLLCRKYGATLAYTPMMSSKQFISDDPTYRTTEFQTIPEDRPLVAHFSANDPVEFAKAAKLVEEQCDAIDLNLGCPQRTAYVGHFGSYLLEKKDRELVCSMVKAASKATKNPIFVKIRLLDTISETIELCRQLKDAGAALIAIHARLRASFERKGPGARDGPAMLDQVLEVKNALKSTGDDIPIISNGNIITFDDVKDNLSFTTADGVMSAEGILDDPTLYLPRYGEVEKNDPMITITDPSPLSFSSTSNSQPNLQEEKKIRKLKKKLSQIESIETKLKNHDGDIKCLQEGQIAKLAIKDSILKEINDIEKDIEKSNESEDSHETKKESIGPKQQTVPLSTLYGVAQDKVALANEYLDLAQRYPTIIRTIVFHTRRILKNLLVKYQLMEECVACTSLEQVRCVVEKIAKYREDPTSFKFDLEKAKREKEALERKRHEEGKRKAFEARMIRKAKREGLEDREYYLKQGAKVPTADEVKRLRKLPRDIQLKEWKRLDHTQHCMSFHLDEGGCKRGRACAFLHVDATGSNTFVESEEVAG